MFVYKTISYDTIKRLWHKNQLYTACAIIGAKCSDILYEKYDNNKMSDKNRYEYVYLQNPRSWFRILHFIHESSQ